jgi:hypothetical protein
MESMMVSEVSDHLLIALLQTNTKVLLSDPIQKYWLLVIGILY